MALAPCRECGRAVSTAAARCPQCGVPDPIAAVKEARDRKAVYRLATVGALLAIAALIAAIRTGMSARASVDSGLARGASIPPNAVAPTARYADSATRRRTPNRDPLVTVTGPTLISTMAVTQADVDSSEATSEALSDYQYYLSRAVPVLEKYGVRVQLSNDSIVRWRDRLGIHSLSVPQSRGMMYVFVLPNGRTRRMRDEVQFDGALLAAAREHFGLPIPDPDPDAEEADSVIGANSAGQRSPRVQEPSAPAPRNNERSAVPGLNSEESSIRRYADRIERHADSVVVVANLESEAFLIWLKASDGPNLEAISVLGARMTTKMRSKINDFDVVLAPPGFERVHFQMLTALKAAADANEKLSARAAYMSCASERAAATGCDGPARRAEHLTLWAGEFSQVESNLEAYAEARERARALLADQSVMLAEIPKARR